MAKTHTLQASLAEGLNDLRVDADPYVPRTVDLLGQTGRDARVDRAGPDHHRHIGRGLCEVERGLRRRGGRADDEDLLAGERRRL